MRESANDKVEVMEFTQTMTRCTSVKPSFNVDSSVEALLYLI